MRPHFKPVHTEELSDDDGETVFRSMVERSSIGWLTPSLIAASLTIATASAIGHYSFFQYLNNGQETSRIPQSWVTTVSTAIVKIFSICVGIALDTEDPVITQTVILNTPMASFTYDASGVDTVSITLDADILQSYLENTMISMLTLSNQDVWTEVTTGEYVNRYSFKYPAKLIIPYATILVGSVVFIILGVLALVRNGVSASSGGFTQLLCTTKGSQILDDMTVNASLGGDAIPDELKNLVVKYGVLRNGAVVRTGFGVPNEVQDLMSGKNYE
ncbi:uncharacterized protein LY89DRAFT_781839 [Mollisia scopiformis]|uniref:Transmembrane protein n=1 Tax=Mollisia scopiformis TaxID=149040 RepID=A0A194XD56_MOLSC|nr:uncharacterized protein LY89DRAFT_781839 [Mollisia scopiformis]KUJ17687.1 hypothetical protein LY89DRAFT_781839 [Mollisia scopiformis]